MDGRVATAMLVLAGAAGREGAESHAGAPIIDARLTEHWRLPCDVRTPEDVETHGRAEKQAGVDQEAGSLSIRTLVTRFMHGP